MNRVEQLARRLFEAGMPTVDADQWSQACRGHWDADTIAWVSQQITPDDLRRIWVLTTDVENEDAETLIEWYVDWKETLGGSSSELRWLLQREHHYVEAAEFRSEWLPLGISLADAEGFARYDISPTEAAKWLQAGCDPESAAELGEEGVPPLSIEIIDEWQQSGFPPDEIWPWFGLIDPPQAREWSEAGFGFGVDTMEPTMFVRAGLQPREAEALREAIWELEGSVDGLEWLEKASNAGLPFNLDTVSRWYPGRMDEVMQSIDLGYPDLQTARLWRESGLKARIALALSDRGVLPSDLSADDSALIRDRGIDDDAVAWILHGVPLAERDAWSQVRMSAEQAAAWRAASFAPPEAARWKRKKFKADDARTWAEAGFDLDEASAWRSAGFGDADALDASLWRASGVDPEVANNRRANGIRPPGRIR